MTREKVKEMLPILKAFTEGKTIQFKDGKGWHDITVNILDCYDLDMHPYRIKPEHDYRPFESAEECWQEMQKHQPFGWVKLKEFGNYSCFDEILDSVNFEMYFNDCTFADGTPFGIKEEE